MAFYERRGTLPEEVDRLDPVFVSIMLAKWSAESTLDREEARKNK